MEMDNHIRAFAGEVYRYGPAKAFGRACDQSDFSV